MRVASDAYRFLIPLFSIVAALSAFAGWYRVTGLLAVLFVFVLSFFRDPERRIPAGSALIVSPADGKVVRIAAATGELPVQISTFLSVFDVHINRAPIAGRVQKIEYRKGRFRAAFDDSASVENEQSIVDLENGGGRIRVVLIAGLIARRIVS